LAKGAPTAPPAFRTSPISTRSAVRVGTPGQPVGVDADLDDQLGTVARQLDVVGAQQQLDAARRSRGRERLAHLGLRQRVGCDERRQGRGRRPGGAGVAARRREVASAGAELKLRVGGEAHLDPAEAPVAPGIRRLVRQQIGRLIFREHACQSVVQVAYERSAGVSRESLQGRERLLARQAPDALAQSGIRHGPEHAGVSGGRGEPP
jgi:hypothetical protein